MARFPDNAASSRWNARSCSLNTRSLAADRMPSTCTSSARRSSADTASETTPPSTPPSPPMPPAPVGTRRSRSPTTPPAPAGSTRSTHGSAARPPAHDPAAAAPRLAPPARPAPLASRSGSRPTGRPTPPTAAARRPPGAAIEDEIEDRRRGLVGHRHRRHDRGSAAPAAAAGPAPPPSLSRPTTPRAAQPLQRLADDAARHMQVGGEPGDRRQQRPSCTAPRRRRPRCRPAPLGHHAHDVTMYQTWAGPWTPTVICNSISAERLGPVANTNCDGRPRGTVLAAPDTARRRRAGSRSPARPRRAPAAAAAGGRPPARGQHQRAGSRRPPTGRR